jgi:hypothetical protein
VESVQLKNSKNKEIKNKFSYLINRILDTFNIIITAISSIIIFILINEDILDCYGSSNVNIVDINIDYNLEELLELRYLDDYMEEPIEIYVNNNPSYFDEFIDLFSRKGNKQHNL